MSLYNNRLLIEQYFMFLKYVQSETSNSVKYFEYNSFSLI